MAAVLKRIAHTEPTPPWGLLTAVVTIVAAFFTIVIGTTLAQIALPNQPVAPLIGWSIGALLMGLFVSVTRNRASSDREALRIGNTTSNLVILLLLSFGVAILLAIISLVATGAAWTTTELLNLFVVGANRVVGRPDVNLFAWIIAFLFLTVFQPVGEELVFRGVAYPALRTALGVWSGFFVCATLYAVFHLLAYAPAADGSFTVIWYGVVLPLLQGLYLTGVRAYTGSTRAAIVAHTGMGLFAFLSALTFIG